MISKFKRVFALLNAMFFAVVGLSSSVDAKESTETKKVLIVYFSHTGNTEIVAKKIYEQFSKNQANLVRIEPQKCYPEYGDKLRKLALQEANNDACRPEFVPINVNVQDYDLVLIGTPVWWYKAPKVVVSFLEKQNFSGKEVRFFITHAGGPGACLDDLKVACKGANFGENINIYCNSPGNGIVNYDEAISWVKNINL